MPLRLIFEARICKRGITRRSDFQGAHAHVGVTLSPPPSGSARFLLRSTPRLRRPCLGEQRRLHRALVAGRPVRRR
eukprot:7494070-Pyramimonas_sp.AAC.1